MSDNTPKIWACLTIACAPDHRGLARSPRFRIQLAACSCEQRRKQEFAPKIGTQGRLGNFCTLPSNNEWSYQIKVWWEQSNSSKIFLILWASRLSAPIISTELFAKKKEPNWRLKLRNILESRSCFF